MENGTGSGLSCINCHDPHGTPLGEAAAYRNLRSDAGNNSPGQVIIRYLLDFALDEGMQEINYGRGDEGYKSRFSNQSQFNRSVVEFLTAQR